VTAPSCPRGPPSAKIAGARRLALFVGRSSLVEFDEALRILNVGELFLGSALDPVRPARLQRHFRLLSRRAVAIETKDRRGSLRKTQKTFRDAWIEAGGVYIDLARGFISRDEALARLGPLPLGSAIACQVVWALDDTAAEIARRAEKAHAIVRAQTRESVLRLAPPWFIRQRAEDIQEAFADVLLPGEAVAVARRCLAHALGMPPKAPEPPISSLNSTPTSDIPASQWPAEPLEHDPGGDNAA
jgi:hypothetical protein